MARWEKIKKNCLYELKKYPEDLNEKNIELHVALATRLHMLDFFSSIEENRIPSANILGGHRSTASCILANIALELRRPLEYDSKLRIIKKIQRLQNCLKDHIEKDGDTLFLRILFECNRFFGS